MPKTTSSFTKINLKSCIPANIQKSIPWAAGILNNFPLEGSEQWKPLRLNVLDKTLSTVKRKGKERNIRKDAWVSKESREEIQMETRKGRVWKKREDQTSLGGLSVVPYICEALSAKELVWLSVFWRNFLSSVSTASKTRYSRTKWAKHQNVYKVLRHAQYKASSAWVCLQILFLSFLLWSSLYLSLPSSSVLSSSFSFHSFRPSLLECFLPWFLLSFVDQLLPYFVASLLPSVLAVCYLIFDTLHLFLDICIPHVGWCEVTKGEQGEQFPSIQAWEVFQGLAGLTRTCHAARHSWRIQGLWALDPLRHIGSTYFRFK